LLMWAGHLGLIYRGGCIIMPASFNYFARLLFVTVAVNIN